MRIRLQPHTTESPLVELTADIGIQPSTFCWRLDGAQITRLAVVCDAPVVIDEISAVPVLVRPPGDVVGVKPPKLEPWDHGAKHLIVRVRLAGPIRSV